jgi:Flp pilus assembly protein TadB
VEVVAILVAAVVIAAVLLLAAATLGARRARRRRAREAFASLSSLRSESGQPFFPETPEDRRRESRLLAGWDPTLEHRRSWDPRTW